MVIDGRNRVACAHECITELSENGVIISDNTDRLKYQKGYDRLRAELRRWYLATLARV